MLWMSTNRGLSRFDSVANRFTNYYTVDGLPGNDFTGWDACFKSASGEMFFGGVSGGGWFFSSQIATNPLSPSPVFFLLFLFWRFGWGVGEAPHSSADHSPNKVNQSHPP